MPDDALQIVARGADKEDKAVAWPKLMIDPTQPVPRPRRWRRRVLTAIAVILLSPLVAIGLFLLWTSLAYNWGPPTMLTGAFRAGVDSERVMTEILNSWFPKGVDEAALKAALLKQGFKDVDSGRPYCRLPDEQEVKSWPGTPKELAPFVTPTRVKRYELCPEGSQQLGYVFSNLACGYRIFVNWSVDDNGKVSRLEATGRSACL